MKQPRAGSLKSHCESEEEEQAAELKEAEFRQWRNFQSFVGDLAKRGELDA